MDGKSFVKGYGTAVSGRLLYLHGFTGAPASHKAQALAARMQAHGLGDAFVCPQLPPSPREAIALAEVAEDQLRRGEAMEQVN